MKVAGIIAEYNPFHLGHQYHLQQTRQLTGADYLVVILSGNFVQRGEPGILDKWVRTQMALLCGADLVLELPAPFACGSAEDFAMGAVSLLHQLGVITHLSFGSEAGALPVLNKAAQIALDESPDYQKALKQTLRQGLTYPQARSAAFCASGLTKEEALLIQQPNNLLGIEYIKTLFTLHSPICPVTLPRKGSSYHAREWERGSYASATALRSAIAQAFSPALQDNCTVENKESCPSAKDRFSFLEQIPQNLHSFYQEDNCHPLFLDDFSSILNYQILLWHSQTSRLSQDAGLSLDSALSQDDSALSQDSGFSQFSDVSSELANRLHRQALTPLSFTERIHALKTRQYTYTRISRALLHLMLTIRREEMEYFRQTGYSSYARILGFKREASPLLSLIKKQATIPLIAKAADAQFILPQPAKALWQKDIFCSQVYALLLQQKYKKIPPDEFRRQIILL